MTKLIPQAQLPQYRDGSIKRVQLHNFMTYDDCLFEPGPGLNLVLGPNGSGKSSIVSALCVGLTGDANLLGRASKVGDYIQRNKKEAFVEITLHQTPPKKDIRIMRMLTSSGSKWKINGKTVTSEYAKETIQRLNIQLNNLTQFLPQDKVTEFASLGPVDLLKQTEHAVLPKNVIEAHQKLIDIQKQYQGMNTTVEDLQNQIEVLKKKNELLERDVEKIRERERLLQEIEKYEIAIPFIQFDEKQKEGRELRNSLKEKESLLKQFDSKLAPIEGLLRKLQADRKRVIENQSSAKLKSEQFQHEFRDILNKMRDLEARDSEDKKRLKSLKHEEKERERTIAEIQQKIKNAQNHLANSKSIEQIGQEINNINPEYKKIDDDLEMYESKRRERKSEIDACHREIAAKKKRLDQLDNIKFQRLEAFRRMGSLHEVRAYEWIQQNSSRFKGKVYFLPLEISVREELHAMYIENHCPRWLLQAFVCEEDVDRQLILREVADRMSLNITVSYASNVNNTLPPRVHDIGQLRKYGVTHFLDETFDAPPIIKQIMNDNAQLYKVACGTSVTNNEWENLFRDTEIKQAFAPGNRYTAKFSKYDRNAISTAVLPLKPTKVFQAVDVSERDKIMRDIDHKAQQINNITASLKEYEEAENNAQVQLERLNALKNQLTKENRSIIQTQQRIGQMQSELKRLDGTFDMVARERELKANLVLVARQRVKYAMQLALKTKEATDLSLEQDRYPLEKLLIDSKAEKVEEEKHTIETNRQVIAQTVDALRKDSTTINHELRKLKDDATTIKERFMEKHPELTNDQFGQIIESLPKDKDTVSMKIADIRERIQQIHNDPSIMEQYEKRKVDIEQKEEALKIHQNNLDNYDSQIKKLKDVWLGSLRPCVETINESFVQNCKNIGISGEVSLSEDETDFDKWAIQIKVKFRDSEQFALLNANRQSGGERSVTTMLYLLSLQALNRCPFRVVDEINQGMDPENERKIFYLMLDSSRGSDVSQSFLITPKLLPNLVPDHANNITILFIYNGMYNLKQEDWDKYANKIGFGNQYD